MAKPNEKPILFSGEMVRAILDGRKTQTRRVVKPQPVRKDCVDEGIYVEWKGYTLDMETDIPSKDCPYGKPGDRLWVRETWSKWENGGRGVAFKADGAFHELLFDGQTPKVILPEVVSRLAESVIELTTWKPSIHMPRAYSRISLEVVSVRVERLQAISESDAKAEGVMPWTLNPDQCLASGERAGDGPHRASYVLLWDELNFDRGFEWQKNPWVWVIEYKKLDAEPYPE